MHETSKAFLWSDNMSQHASCFIMSNTMRNKCRLDGKGGIKDDGVQWTEYPSHTFEFHFLF